MDDKTRVTKSRDSTSLRPLNGVVLLDKPAGCTSNAALQQVRKIYGAKKAGHTGSLDPSATGMLPICFGEGTKLCGYLLNAQKTYLAEGLLGVTTDTDDAEGQILKRSPVPVIDPEQLRRIVSGFLGESMQQPPIYSAIKKNGIRAHKMARNGEQPQLEPRRVVIHEIDLLHFDGERFSVRMRVSKGTYVRSIVRDIGENLGCGAHVTQLRRLGVTPFDNHTMHSVEEIQEHTDKLLLGLDEVVSDWPMQTLDETTALKFRHGSKPLVERSAQPGTGSSGDMLRIYGPENSFLGLGKISDGRLQTVRIIGAQLQ